MEKYILGTYKPDINVNYEHVSFVKSDKKAGSVKEELESVKEKFERLQIENQFNQMSDKKEEFTSMKTAVLLDLLFWSDKCFVLSICEGGDLTMKIVIQEYDYVNNKICPDVFFEEHIYTHSGHQDHQCQVMKQNKLYKQNGRFVYFFRIDENDQK